MLAALAPAPLPAAGVNANLGAAALVVEELCRLGVNTFAVAPGNEE
jgi:hypothetical protein